jgi:hypothetical protein
VKFLIHKILRASSFAEPLARVAAHPAGAALEMLGVVQGPVFDGGSIPD